MAAEQLQTLVSPIVVSRYSLSDRMDLSDEVMEPTRARSGTIDECG